MRVFRFAREPGGVSTLEGTLDKAVILSGVIPQDRR